MIDFSYGLSSFTNFLKLISAEDLIRCVRWLLLSEADDDDDEDK